MTRHRSLGRTAAMVLAAVCTVVVWASPAAASCAALAVPSPHAFTGTVVETRNHGREAAVRTDSGELVSVLGSAEEGAITSVDRHFAVGGRYEFHPTNGSSPYRDNECTATRQLSGPLHTPDTDHGLPGAKPGWLPFDDDAGPGLAALSLLLPGGALAAVAVVGVRTRWTRRSPS